MADAFLSNVGKEIDDRDSRGHHRDSSDRYHSRRRSRSPYRGGGGDRRYDDRGPPPRHYDDRGPPPRRDWDDRRHDRGGPRYGHRDGGGGGGGGGGGRGGFGGGGRGGGGMGGRRGENGVFGSPNVKRSPTPEGTVPISKRPRKFTAWDVKAPGYESMTAMDAKISGAFMLPGQTRPMIGGMTGYGTAPMSRDGGFGMPGSLAPIHFRPLNPSDPSSGAPPGTVSQPLQAFARQARRLYVGNIQSTANEQNVAEFFNAKMKEAGLVEAEDALKEIHPDPVVAVQVNHEKNYAFVEFRNSEEASKAVSFDGIVFQDQVVKIRRPKEYTEGSSISGNVPDSPHKIFVGGLPSYLTDDQVMELLKSFGELKSFNLVKDAAGTTSKGFAFCEYVDPEVTDAACVGLNGMTLGDRLLVVQRAQVGALPGGVPMPGGGPGAGSPVGGMVYGQQTAAQAVLQAVQGEEAEMTRVLQMLNMVQPEELLDDGEFEEIVEDIKEECGKYGTVEDVRIPRPVRNDKGKVDQRASESVKDLGKVFVLFSNTAESKKALQAIAGRQFAGRVIICAFAPEEVMLG